MVGSDNWYGTIPASTVYYPARLETAGKLLALDLGHPAHRAGGRPDAARPAHRHPHRPARTDASDGPSTAQCDGLRSWSSPPEEGEQRYAALVRAAAETVVGLDFDGTLAPIVEDPSEAHIHPDAGEVLVDLADQVLAVAVVTGRPARQALDLGGLEEVGNAIGDPARSSTSSASTATSAGAPPTAG